MTIVKQQQRKLRLRIKKAIEESLKLPMKVVIIYDSSCSIEAEDFEKEKQCGKRIISALPPRTKIAAMHFSSTVGLIAGFEASREELYAANAKAVRFAQNTETCLALDTARDLFRVTRSDDAERHLVILLTDGRPQRQEEAEIAAANLRRDGCELIGIGLGDLDAENLIRVVGRENFFLLDSWDTLAATLNTIPNSSRFIVPESEVFIEATQMQVPVRLDEPIPLTLTISNTGLVPITPGAILKMSDSSQYYKNEVRVIGEQVGIGGSIDMTVSLAPLGRPRAEDLPEVVEWTLQDPVSRNFYYVTSEGFEIQTHNMFGEFLAWKPVSHVKEVANICLFGPAGAGKSRLNNSFVSIFSESQPRVAEEFGTKDHTTKEITVYGVAESIVTEAGIEPPEVKFRFFDTFGLSNETYQRPGEFAALVDGALPMAWGRKDTRPIPQTGCLSRRIDAIIFVLPQGAVLDEEKMKLTRQFVERAVRDRRMAPIAVITHADALEPEEWEPIRLKAKEALGLQQVFMLDNSEAMAKTFVRDKALYLILRSALQSAQEFIKAQDARDMQQMLPK